MKDTPSGKQSFGYAIKMGLQLAEMGFRRRLGLDLGRDKKMEIVHRLQMGAAKLSRRQEIPSLIRISPHELWMYEGLAEDARRKRGDWRGQIN